MPALTKEAKAYIAHSLARFEAPSAVAMSVKEFFGLSITRQSVEAYDPTKRAGRSLGADYRAAFMAEREAYLSDTMSIGIAAKANRLRGLQRICDRAEATGNFPLAIRVIAQAAREMGQDRQ